MNFALMVAVGMTLSAGRWDGSYDRIGAVSPNNSSVNLQVTSTAIPPYISVECGTNDAYVGNGVGSSTSCSATTCKLIKFSLGEKYYSQLTGKENYVAVYSTGSFTCQVFRGKP